MIIYHEKLTVAQRNIFESLLVLSWNIMLGSVQVLYKRVRGGGGLKSFAYFAYVVRGVGGLEAKCLCKRSEFLSTCK